MGTRSITVVKDIDNNKIIEMYVQYDGYPSGHGQNLLNFINSIKMVDSRQGTGTANGIECFAAQLICEFKQGPGGTYLHTPTTSYKNKKKYYEMYNAEYYYEIDSNLNLICWDCYEDKIIHNNGEYYED